MSLRKVCEFICINCKYVVWTPLDQFGHDHCPECYVSVHQEFGDAPCGSMMFPVADFSNTKDGLWGTWECSGCKYIHRAPIKYIATPKEWQQLVN